MGDGGRPPRRRAFWSAAAVAAATLVAVLFVAPLSRTPTSVSAAEILAASADRLAQAPASGIEVLEYELILDGMPRDLMPDHQNGAYTIRQAIDHGTPGRFRYASFDPNGVPVSSIAQDPAHNRRVMMINLDGQRYRFETTIPGQAMSVPEIERLHMQASIALMQASGNQLVETIDTAAGRQYRIEVSQAGAPVTGAMWDLSHARVLVGADDYRIIEFAVTGTVLKQPYSVSYRLINRAIVDALEPGAFDIAQQAGEIRLSGDGSLVPARDVMMMAFRELARLQQER